MINDTIFEIPVYSCSQEQFNAKITDQIDKLMQDVPKNYGNAIWEEQRQEELNQQLGSIRFNEVIGYIEIYLFGSQLRADYWFSEKSRIVIGSKSKGRITSRGRLLERHFQPHRKLKSSQIFKQFRESLERAAKGNNLLKRRHVDYAAFDRCGPFIDWAKIIEMNVRPDQATV